MRIEPGHKFCPAAFARKNDLKISADYFPVFHYAFDLPAAPLLRARVGVDEPKNVSFGVFCAFVKLFAAIRLIHFNQLEIFDLGKVLNEFYS